jgi:hypothetical protein
MMPTEKQFTRNSVAPTNLKTVAETTNQIATADTA